jgi:hypothetical protein
MEEALDFSRPGSPVGGAGEFHQRLGGRRL